MTILVADARAELERFVAERFHAAYGARVKHFCTHLIGMRGAEGAWRAAAGFTPAARDALYLEHYLDRPVETLLADAAGTCVPRSRIVEVGNLASAAKGFGGRFLPALREHLVEGGYRWAVFTATREVRAILSHLAFDACALAPALARCLPDAGAGWGTYYDHDPAVMAGCIA
jgi:hypothetical protein